MAVDEIPLFGMLKAKMGWLSARQGVLADNVAHADTPGHQARDLDRPDFRKFVDNEPGLAMRTAGAGHLSGAGRSADPRTRVSGTWEAVPDGNSVSVEHQMMKVTETAGEYRLATSLYTKSMGLIRMAIGGR